MNHENNGLGCTMKQWNQWTRRSCTNELMKPEFKDFECTIELGSIDMNSKESLTWHEWNLEQGLGSDEPSNM